jgi:hypothetical protein
LHLLSMSFNVRSSNMFLSLSLPRHIRRRKGNLLALFFKRREKKEEKKKPHAPDSHSADDVVAKHAS